VRARRDAVCCSVRCRQARHRFTRAAGRAVEGTSAVAGGRPRRLAYADPPYPGKAFYYRDHPDYAGEVDHAELIRRLCRYDGWALSTSAAALPAVLALCPPGVRVAAWHRGERPTRAWQPLNAWEPVIYLPGRPLEASRATGGTRRVDSLVHGVTPMTTLPGRVVGAKPAAFCRWLFDLLAALPGDSLDDLFPGSGAVTRAWHAYTATPAPAASTGPAGDASGAACPDASGQAWADGSPGSARDVSTGPAPDASNPTAAGRDVSTAAACDASGAGLPDASGVDARRLPGKALEASAAPSGVTGPGGGGDGGTSTQYTQYTEWRSPWSEAESVSPRFFHADTRNSRNPLPEPPRGPSSSPVQARADPPAAA
jgi:hypothetical protein